MDKIKNICETINERFKKSSFAGVIRNFDSLSNLYADYTPIGEADIASLKAQGCECDDWKKLFVAPGFNASAMKNVSFLGSNYISDFKSGSTVLDSKVSGNSICQIKNATIKNSYINNCIIRNVDLIENIYVDYDSEIIGSGFITFEKPYLPWAHAIHPGNELKTRTILCLPEMNPEMIRACLDFKTDEQARMYEIKNPEIYDVCRPISYGYIGHKTVIHQVKNISLSWIGDYCHIEGAQSISESTVIGDELHKTKVGFGTYINKSFVQPATEVLSGAQVSNSFLLRYSHISNNAMVSESVISANTEISKGEVTACYLGPFIGFHHLSLLISTIWTEGKGNIGAGAKVGSNHTGRRPDQECKLGEGCFIGLGVSIKFPSNLSHSEYSIIAPETLLPPQKVQCPFSLIAPNNTSENHVDGFSNQIFPGWVWKYNFYGLIRNIFKYQARDKSIEEHPDYSHTLYSDNIITTICKALDELQNVKAPKVAGQDWSGAEIPCLGQNRLSDKHRKESIQIYKEYLNWIQLLNLLEDSTAHFSPDVLKLISRHCPVPNKQKFILENSDLLTLYGKRLVSAMERDFQKGTQVFSDYADHHSNDYAADPVVKQFNAYVSALRAKV